MFLGRDEVVLDEVMAGEDLEVFRLSDRTD